MFLSRLHLARHAGTGVALLSAKSASAFQSASVFLVPRTSACTRKGFPRLLCNNKKHPLNMVAVRTQRMLSATLLVGTTQRGIIKSGVMCVVLAHASAAPRVRDDECSRNGTSDQINIKCDKTQLMCRVTLNTLSAPGEHTLQWRKESGKVLATQPSPRVRDAPAKPQKKTLSETAHLKKSFLSLSSWRWIKWRYKEEREKGEREKGEREKGNEDVCLQPSATTSARDDECSSNGSDQINTKCGKTQLMCRVTLNIISTLVMLLLLEATSTARKWKEKNESVSFQPSATTSARDDECSSNGSDQINTKCAKTHQMCRVTLNIISTLVMLLLLEATAKEKNEGGGKNGWKLPSRVWRGEVGA